MSKTAISKLFLYKHRFVIGYLFLAVAFLVLLFGLPLVAPSGLSAAEMESTVVSYTQTDSNLATGNIIDLPYHLLQKLSIIIFGLNSYSIKLPSIIIGFFLGILFILLLNRWFKNNVAILAGVLAVLSSSFLFSSGYGTPLIMIVFWPTLLLWLGSKIQNVKRPRPLYSYLFAFALLFSLFTPYMIYLAFFILLYVAFTPHLRFTVKSLPRIPFVIVSTLIVGGCTFIIMHIIRCPETIAALMFTDQLSISSYFQNIGTALLPFFSWNGMVESVFLAPLISLPTLVLALIGLISTAKGFRASRNSIASYIIIFTIIICGFNPNCAILLVLPTAILVAHGLRYILNKWYGIFPENPYARVFGIIPIAIFMSIMIFSDISHFYFGYRYNPPVVSQFTNDLELLDKTAKGGDTLLLEPDTLEYRFYSLYASLNPILGGSHTLKIATTIPESILEGTHFLTFGKQDNFRIFWYELEEIVTSPASSNSDRIYVYHLRSWQN